jgi:hypothetical protein
VLPGSFLARELVKPDRNVPAFEERDEDEHELEPWDDSDRERLGLKPEGTQPADAEQSAPRPARPFRVYRGGRLPAARSGN